MCWSNLEQFNEFHSFVATNYHIEIKELKYQIPEEADQDESMIVFDDGDKVGSEMIKVEIINDTEHFDETSDWLEEEEASPPKKVKRVTSIAMDPSKISRQSSVTDSADDQRIRETACMSCEICCERLSSLRDAKAHFKVIILICPSLT
jgi:hypothetical protein